MIGFGSRIGIERTSAIPSVVDCVSTRNPGIPATATALTLYVGQAHTRRMPYIPGEDELNWKRRVRKPFYIFNSVAMIPVATDLIASALDYLSPSYFDMLGYGPAAITTLFGPVAIVSIPVNMTFAIVVRRRDPRLSLVAFLLFLVVLGLLLSIPAKGLLHHLALA